MNPEYGALDLLSFHTECYELDDGVGTEKHINPGQNAHPDLEKIVIFIVKFSRRDDVYQHPFD